MTHTRSRKWCWRTKKKKKTSNALDVIQQTSRKYHIRTKQVNAKLGSPWPSPSVSVPGYPGLGPSCCSSSEHQHQRPPLATTNLPELLTAQIFASQNIFSTHVTHFPLKLVINSHIQEPSLTNQKS